MVRIQTPVNNISKVRLVAQSATSGKKETQSLLCLKHQEPGFHCEVNRICFVTAVLADSELQGWFSTFPHHLSHGLESGSCVVGAEFTGGWIEWPDPKTQRKGASVVAERRSIPFSPLARSNGVSTVTLRIFGLPQPLLPSLSRVGTPPPRETEPLWSSQLQNQQSAH